MKNRSNVPITQISTPERPTYRWHGIITPAANATDILTLIGTSNKVVRLTKLHLQGVSTAASLVAFNLIRRTGTNTGGTNTLLNSAIDVAVTLDSGASATLTSYTANPTVLGAGGNAFEGGSLYCPAAATPTFNAATVFNFDSINATSPQIVRSPTTLFAVNLGGLALPAGLAIDTFIEWTEDDN